MGCSSFRSSDGVAESIDDPNDEFQKIVYHCTLKDSAASIIQTGFRFPTADIAREKGLKLGAAVYFGDDPQYCVHEALNTLAGNDEFARRDMIHGLAMIQARVRMGRSLSLGDYGRITRDGLRGLSGKQAGRTAEMLTRDQLLLFGYDTIQICEDTMQAEVAIYDKSAILNMNVVKLDVVPPAKQLESGADSLQMHMEDNVQTLFHCTTLTCAENIMRVGFAFPTAKNMLEKGLKLGAAVYFGEQAEYCYEQALSSLAGADWGYRQKMKPKLRLIAARVNLGEVLSLGDYHRGVRAGARGLSARRFEQVTAELTKAQLCLFGYDTVAINEGTDASEVGIYDTRSIENMAITVTTE